MRHVLSSSNLKGYNGMEKSNVTENLFPCNPRSQDNQSDTQTHVHEIQGSVKLAEEGEDRHNHRFATVSSQVIPSGNSHKHAFFVSTDFFDHHHEVAGETGLAIKVGNGKHVHFATGQSTIDDGHFHDFQFATLIDSPLLPS